MMRRTEDWTQAPTFQAMFAHGADLGAAVGGARGTQTQLLVEHIGGGAQKAVQNHAQRHRDELQPRVESRPLRGWQRSQQTIVKY